MKTTHTCPGEEKATSINEIYVDIFGDWVLDLNDLCCTTDINYCPFCGEKLPKKQKGD